MTDASSVPVSVGDRADLEAATQAIIGILPSNDRPNFKVYDAGLYLHRKSASGGLSEAWNQAIAAAENDPASEFYLLLARESDHEGLNKRIRAKLKLPNTPAYACLSQEDRSNLEKYVAQVANDHLHLGYVRAEKEAISLLGKYLYRAIVCHCSGSEPGCKFQNIDLQLLALGFRKKQIELGGTSTWASGSQGIFDYKGRKAIIDGEEYDIGEQVAEGKTMVDAALSGNVYIFDEESFSNGEWDNAQIQAKSLQYAEFWVILTDDKGNSFLYSRFTLGGNLASARPPNGTENNAVTTISPWGLALKALGNAALDAVVQAVVIRIIDEKAADWGYAFGQVSYLGAAWEGLSSLLPWKKDLATSMVRAAAAAFVGVLDKAFNQPDYGVNEGIRDFVVGFAASGVIQLLTHPAFIQRVGAGKYAQLVFRNGLDRIYFSGVGAPLKRVCFHASKLFDDFFATAVSSVKYIEQGAFITGVKKIDLMGGKTSQLGPPFVNLDLKEEITNGIKGDATALSKFIPANSIDEIVCTNPYLGGNGSAEDYIKEIAKVIKSGKKVYLNGTLTNKYFNKVNLSLASQYGFIIESYQQPLLQQFQNLIFKTTDGGLIPIDKMKSTVLIKQ